MMHILTLGAVAYMHVFLSPDDAISFARRWRPQNVGGHVVSVTGIKRYTRTCIHLHSDMCTGAVVQLSDDGKSCLYVLHRNVSTENENGEERYGGRDVHVASILWQKEERMLFHIKALRLWYSECFRNEILGGTLLDDIERDLWYLSEFDA
jgi:hypothetical protein